MSEQHGEDEEREEDDEEHDEIQEQHNIRRETIKLLRSFKVIIDFITVKQSNNLFLRLKSTFLGTKKFTRLHLITMCWWTK
jgi:hypothetical protein